MGIFYDFLKLFGILLLVAAIIFLLYFSPMWYQLAKKYHSTHICEVKTDCMTTNLTPNICTNESGAYYYSREKIPSITHKNHENCECKNYFVTNMCDEK